MEHPIQGLMKATMENLKEMVDVNTIIGEPVQTTDGGVILTVSKVSFGYGAGGSDFSANQSAKEKDHLAFGGGSAGGVCITPVAFLVVNNDGVNIMHLQNGTHLAEKIIELAPQTFSKIQTMFSQNNATNTTNAANMANPMNTTNAANMANATNMTNPANMANATNMTNPANMANATNMTNPANMTSATNMTNPANMTSATNMTNPTNTANATNMTNPANMTSATNMTNPTNLTSATDATYSANTTTTKNTKDTKDTTNTTNPMNVTSSVEEKMQMTEQSQNDIF
ncbi:GerW family sporulation protein [Microbacteriaceae bacterium 4G12]